MNWQFQGRMLWEALATQKPVQAFHTNLLRSQRPSLYDDDCGHEPSYHRSPFVRDSASTIMPDVKTSIRKDV